MGKCKKSGYFLPNTLGTVNFYALSCRTDEKFCGKNGILFESKNWKTFQDITKERSFLS